MARIEDTMLAAAGKLAVRGTSNGPMPPPRTALDAVGNALSLLQTVRKATADLRGHLVGSEPEAEILANHDEPAPDYRGVLGDLTRMGDEASALARGIMRDLGAISAKLPG